MSDQLNFHPVLKRQDLLPSSVTDFFQSKAGSNLANHIEVAEIDPAYTGSAEFTAHYGVLPENGANTVIVEAVRGEDRTIAACLVPIGTRADLNSLVRKTLNARRVSFAPLEEVLKETFMEYGSITVVGLPSTWRILIDAKLTQVESLIVGGGLVKSKMRLPGKLLEQLPNSLIIDNLGKAI